MSMAAMNTNQALKQLKDSGMDATQAATVIDVIIDLHQANGATKEDVKQAEYNLTTRIGEVSNQMVEIKSDIRHMQSDFSELRTEVKRLQEGVRSLQNMQSDFSNLRTEVKGLQEGVRSLQTSYEKLNNNMMWVKNLIIPISVAIFVAIIKYLFFM